MKKTMILLAVTLCFTAGVKAQKTDTTKKNLPSISRPITAVPKPVYTPDTKALLIWPNNFTMQEWFDFLTVNTQGKYNLQHSPNISAAIVTGMIDSYTMVGDSLSRMFSKIMEQKFKKWQADTAKVRVSKTKN
jgi:hypothetical protein